MKFRRKSEPADPIDGAIENDAVVLEVAPGVHSRFVKQVIGRVIDPAADAPAESTDTTDTTAAEATDPVTDTKAAEDKPTSTKPSDSASS